MTTEFRIEGSPDLFVDNDTLLFVRPSSGTSCQALAGITFIGDVTSETSIDDVRHHALEVAFTAVGSALPNHVFWLFGIHTAWQPDTRLLRKLGFWKGLERQEVLRMRSDGRPEEQVITTEHGIKYASAVQIARSQLDLVHQVWKAEPGSLFVSLPGQTKLDIDVLVKAGWSDWKIDPSYWRDIAFVVCAQDGILFRPFGGFDDRQAGVDLIVPAHHFPLIRKTA